MGEDKKGGYCPYCQQQRLLIKDTPNHILHLLLAIFTAGLWLFIWILLCLLSGTAKWRCTQCGSIDIDSPTPFSEQPPVSEASPDPPKIQPPYKKEKGIEFWSSIAIIITGFIAAQLPMPDIIPALMILGGTIWLIVDRFHNP